MYEVDNYIYDAFRHEKNPIMAEKDYLECLILDRVFNDSFFSKNFVFAGGGTITKVYKIGNRIGQDIDLAYTAFEDLPEKHGTRALNKFKKNFNDFVFNDLKDKACNVMKDIGKFTVVTDSQIRASQPVKQGRAQPTLHILYSSNVTPSAQKCIDLEFIPRHYKPETVDLRSVVPYSLGTPTSKEIPTVNYAQTFWDKIYALHIIHQIGLMRPGLAHHYYDVANLAPCINLEKTQYMFKEIEKYQQTYTTRHIISPERTSDIDLIPQTSDLQLLEKDYANMQNRFIGRSETWPNIMTSLIALNKNIKTL